MKPIFLGLGSNVGDRLAYLQNAVKMIGTLAGVSLRRSSRVYETDPVGFTEQPEFLNAVLEVESDLPAGELFRRVKGVEVSLGRRGRGKWGPREIDIDILFYGSLLFAGQDLNIPHPQIPFRRFVLEPLAELAPDFLDPKTGRTIQELLRDCADRAGVRATSTRLLLFQEQ